MIDHSAAKHADFAQRIEDGDVGRSLGVVERVVVLGIEEARIIDGDHRGLALPLDARGAEVDHATLDEFSAALQGFRFRHQHRFAKMQPRVGDSQHLGKKDTLIDFDAVFLALHQRAFGIDLLLVRCQSRNQFRGGICQIIHAPEF